MMPNPNELERMTQELAAAGEPDFVRPTPPSDVVQVTVELGAKSSVRWVSLLHIKQARDPRMFLTMELQKSVDDILKEIP